MVPEVARKFVVVTETAETDVMVPRTELRVPMMPVSALRLVIDPVAETKVPIVPNPIVAVLALRVVPVAVVNPSEVAKREVPVAPV